MATRRWLGHAADIKQVDTLAVAGTWVTGDTITLRIDNIDVVVTIGSLVTTGQVATTIKQAFNGETLTDTTASVVPTGGGAAIPQHNEITASVASSTVTFTADTAGVPFTMTGSETAVAGSITYTADVTAATGKNFWSNADNWSGNAVPVSTDDVYFEEGAIDCLYGLGQSAVTLTSLNVHKRYTGKIGLPNRNANGYSEYRATYLAVSATTVTLGNGSGNGSGRIKLDTGINVATLFVFGTGATAEAGLEPLLWKGTHASNAVNISYGSLGIAVLPGETANVSGGLRLGSTTGVTQRLFGGSSGTVRCGSGVTLATITKDGGTLETDSNITTLNNYGGDTVAKSGNITTVTIGAGTLFYLGVGTITTANISGMIDFSRDERARTLTTTNLYRGGTINDPAKSVTFTNGIVLQQCQVSDVNLILGPNRTLTPA